MCNWISSLLASGFMWGLQDSICDVIIGSKEEQRYEKVNVAAISENGKIDKNEKNGENASFFVLNANQMIFICMIAAFTLVYSYSLLIIVTYDHYMDLVDHSSLLFRKEYDLKFFLLLASGFFCFMHYFYLLKAYEYSSSTIILPLLQFSSIVVLLFSSIQKIILKQTWLEKYEHLAAYMLILIGGLFPASRGSITNLISPKFWTQQFIKHALLAETFHGFYNLCISFQEDEDNYDQNKEFNIYKDFEFFYLTRIFFILSCMVYFFWSSKFKDDISKLKFVSFPLFSISLINEYFALSGYFLSAYAYQCYYLTGVINAAESSLNQLINLTIAYIMKKCWNLGREESLVAYQTGQEVNLMVNELFSEKTQLPFEYYSVKFCNPEFLENTEENLGAMILGEKRENSAYKISMLINKTCEKLCKQSLTEDDIDNFIWMIERDYKIYWMIESLPAVHNHTEERDEGFPEVVPEIGFPIGFKQDDEYYLYNHIKIFIDYYPIDKNSNISRIVNFYVEPYSLDQTTACDSKGNLKLKKNAGNKQSIIFTYDVVFNESPKMLASKWDIYASLQDENNVHWLPIMNSFMVIIFLTGIIAHIVRKALRNDLKNYDELRTSEDVQDESGWKQLHRDVFRPPKRPLLFAVLIGAGVQVVSMVVLTLLFGCIGFAKQTYRGSILSMILVLFVLMGGVAGYWAARLYKMMNGAHWFKCILLTAFAYPGINFCIFLIVNLFLVAEKSSGAVNHEVIVILIALWFGISVPLVFLGGFIGFKKDTIKNPCKSYPIPRFLPPQPWYLNIYFCCFFGGLLPFGAVFFELVFIMISIWKHSFYYLFAFLFLVLIILIITCSEISIVITYLQLCNGNHRWWWRSFLISGSSSLYIFAYSVFYYLTQLEITRFSSTIIYFSYMLIISYTFFIFCGTIGALSSYFFVRKIYSMIKVD